MAAYHNTGYDYHPGLSTAGIIYNGEDGIPRFEDRLGRTLIPHLPQVANHPIKFCSSSDGLIACYDPISNIYYIGNPGSPNSYIPLPESPRQHNPYNSNAILVSDFSVQHAYHLICAVLDGMTVYNFDAYSSFYGRWLSHGRTDLECYIIPNTGVSCGSFAYWLTEEPRSVIKFNVNSPRNMLSKMLLDRRILGFPGTMLQLGRVGNKLGLVTLDASFNPRVSLYLLEQGYLGEFQLYVAFNLPISSLSITRLIRFQSFKAELFFWVDGRLFLWEENTVDQGDCLRMVNTGEVQVGYGLAHVITPLLPGNFPIMVQNIHRDDDDC